MNRRIITNILVALIIGISVLVIISSVSKEKVPWDEILSREVIRLLIVGIFINIIYFIIDGFRVYKMASALEGKIRFIDAVESCLMYSFFSAITPSSIGGQPFQIYFLAKKGIKSETATNITLFRAFEYLLMVFGVDIYALIFILPHLPQWTVGKTIIGLGFAGNLLSVILIGVIMMRPDIFKFIMAELKKIKRLTSFIERWEKQCYAWIDSLKLSINSLWRDKKTVIFDFFLLLILILLHSYLFFLPVRELTGAKISFITFFGIQMLLSSLGSYIPTPGASGGIEAIFYSSFKDIISSPQYLLLGITIYRIVTYYLIILVGIPVIIKNQKLLVWGEGGNNKV